VAMTAAARGLALSASSPALASRETRGLAACRKPLESESRREAARPASWRRRPAAHALTPPASSGGVESSRARTRLPCAGMGVVGEDAPPQAVSHELSYRQGRR